MAMRLPRVASRGTSIAARFARGPFGAPTTALRCAPRSSKTSRLDALGRAIKEDHTGQSIVVNAVTPLRLESVDTGLNQPALRECVARAIRRYLADRGEHSSDNLYRLVLAEVETPLLAEVMRHCEGNQTRAAELLGITRATLRKKLVEAKLA
jgi:Fis family transcriptional regulator